MAILKSTKLSFVDLTRTIFLYFYLIIFSIQLPLNIFSLGLGKQPEPLKSFLLHSSIAQDTLLFDRELKFFSYDVVTLHYPHKIVSFSTSQIQEATDSHFEFVFFSHWINVKTSPLASGALARLYFCHPSRLLRKLSTDSELPTSISWSRKGGIDKIYFHAETQCPT